MLQEGPGVKSSFTTLQPRAVATEDSTAVATEDSTAVRIFALESSQCLTVLIPSPTQQTLSPGLQTRSCRRR